MSNSSCKRCGYECEFNYLLIKHLKRKFVCNPILNDIPPATLIQEITSGKGKYCCKHCKKAFNCPQGKYQHQKHCKMKNEFPKFLDASTQHLEVNDIEAIHTNNISNTNTEISKLRQEFYSQISLLKKENKQIKLELQLIKNKKNEVYYQNILENLLEGTHKKLDAGITDITTDTFHAEIKQWDCWKEAIGQLQSYNCWDPKEEMRLYLFGKYSDACKQTATKVITQLGIRVFDCIDVNDGVDIYDMESNIVVLQWKSALC